ncbi:MAG: heavy-metal-associated domain-containing protein [Bacteroidales bacterium]|nr:heavy-metal-associated domain-containing protein [Bacteroidales bacterium]
MKKFILLLSFSLALVSISLSVNAQEKKEKKEKKIETMVCWASVDCEGCVATINKNIAFEKGVKDLNVDLKTKLVTIKYRKDKTSPEKLEKAIIALGYKTELIKADKTKKSDNKKVVKTKK